MNQSRYLFGMCVDFFSDLTNTAFDQAYLVKLFRLFQRWGMTRIYWIYTLKHEEGLLECLPYAGLVQNAENTYSNIGEFLPAAVRAAHACGLQIYAVYKPFDLAFNETVPFGSRAARQYGKFPSISGEIYWAAAGLVKLRQMRLARNADAVPADVDVRVIRTIKFVSNRGDPTRIGKDCLRLMVSDDNYTYREYERDFSFTDRIEDGRRVIILGNLAIDSKYLSVHTPFRDSHGTFQNRLANLAEMYDDSGSALPFVYGLISREDHYCRIPLALVDDLSPRGGYLFDKYNDQLFDMPDRYDDCVLDNRRGYLAFAKGKDRYVPGALSPAYTQVREYWLGHIKECLNAGVDGVDIRLANHNHALEWDCYGFEEPVIEEYRRRYGPGPLERAGQLDIISDYYTGFYRKAATLIRSAGKKVQLHIGTCALLSGRRAYMGLKWDWRRWIEEGLADEITLKDIWPGEQKITEAIYEYSSKRDIPIYACPYLNGIAGDQAWVDSFRRSLADSRRGGKQNGFIWYESAGLVRERPAGEVETLLPEVPGAIREAAAI